MEEKGRENQTKNEDIEALNALINVFSDCGENVLDLSTSKEYLKQINETNT